LLLEHGQSVEVTGSARAGEVKVLDVKSAQRVEQISVKKMLADICEKDRRADATGWIGTLNSLPQGSQKRPN
jgi:hypothetical protein